MSDLAAAIRESEAFFASYDHAVGSVLLGAVDTLEVKLFRALLAAAREAESALASERERADRAETIARECNEQYHARRDALIAAEDRAVKAESALRAASAGAVCRDCGGLGAYPQATLPGAEPEPVPCQRCNMTGREEAASAESTPLPCPVDHSTCSRCGRDTSDDPQVFVLCDRCYGATKRPQPAPLEEAAERVRGMLWGWTNYKVADSEFRRAVEDLLSALDSARGGGGA